MAQAGQGKIHPGRRKANPMMTKNGKPRLGPLNIKQLTDLLAKTTKPKEKVKIQNYVTRKIKKQHVEAKL
jgi:hypothetical protein